MLLLTGRLAAAANSCGMPVSAPGTHTTHTVQAGDTLWDIAEKFLRDPWCWRTVWLTNREHISNPHWIFPGQRLMLDRTRGGLVVLEAQPNAVAAEKLSPAARASVAFQSSTAPEIDPKLLVIKSGYRLMSIATASTAPRIVGSREGHRLLAIGDVIQANEPLPVGDHFDVLRPLPPLQDEQGKPPLALPLKRIGQVRRQANPSQMLQIVQAEAELGEGDLLLPAPGKPDPLLGPHAIPKLQAKILAVMRDGRWASQYDVVALNRGWLDGLQPGSMVDITLPDKIELNGHHARLHESIATLWVFEAEDHVALALIMRSQGVIAVGSIVHAASPRNQ